MAKERSTALEQMVNLDTEMVTWLREERDELRHTTEWLCSERSAAYEECDQAIRERNDAQQRIGSL